MLICLRSTDGIAGEELRVYLDAHRLVSNHRLVDAFPQGSLRAQIHAESAKPQETHPQTPCPQQVHRLHLLGSE